MSSALQTHTPPSPSALTSLIDSVSAKLPINALPLEVLHNLRYQHNWTNIQIHASQSCSAIDTAVINSLNQNDPLTNPRALSTLRPPPVLLLSGIPPQPIYTHPDFQAHLVANSLTDSDIPAQHEWVLPQKIGEKWTLERFCAVFDALPARALLHGAGGHTHQDAKRVLLAMVSHPGKGGDGTIVYYIMQEGDVKPRQN